MDALKLDLAYALRAWRRQPGITTIAVAALALGIGANTTVFSFVSGALLKPLPYPHPDHLVMAFQDRSLVGGSNREVISPGLFVDWSARATSFSDIAAVRNWSPNLTGRDGGGSDEPERLSGAAVTGGYFSVLGIAPLVGRSFSSEDDKPGASTSVVLSHRLWTRRFGSDRSLVGRSIQLDGQPAEVIGVMPESFRGAVVDADLWSTMRIDPANAQRGIVMLRAIGRLRADTSFEKGQAAMATLQSQLQQEDPELVGARARLIRLHDDVVGPARPVLRVLMGCVAMVLLIACANVASLLMARATERRAEMSLRMTLGADSARLIRQLMTESALLAAVGSAFGLALAHAGVRVLAAMAPPSSARLQDIHIDATVLVFTATIGVIAAIAAGLLPALNVARGSINAGLRDGPADGRGLATPRTILVAAEIATAMTLVVGAGLFVRSLISLQAVDLGFRPEGLLTASVSPPRSAYRGDDAVRALFDRMLERASQLPGVESASMTSVLPLSGMQINFSFRIMGRPEGRIPGEEPVASFRSVGSNYLSTMGMRVVRGRGFGADDREGAPMVVVVNEALVRKYWPGESPLGSEIRLNGDRATIVGVVADIHHAGPATTPDGEAYVPYSQLAPRGGGWLVLRTKGDPAAVAASLRAAIRQVDSNLPLAAVRTMPSLVESSVAQPRFLATLLTWFSTVATALALMGVYGLLTFSVGRRVREIGVRMAIGASRESVVLMVLRQSAVVVLVGVGAGIVCAAALAQLIQPLLFAVKPLDPFTFTSMTGLIVIASFVASYLPARRASRINPVVALRDE